MIVYDDVRNVHGDRLAVGYNMVIDDIEHRVTVGWEQPSGWQIANRSELPSGRMEPKISFETDAEADEFIREMRNMGANEIIFGNPKVINEECEDH